MRMGAAAILLATFLAAGCLPAARVARVIDGDTVVLEGGRRVRLLGIDSPELKSPGGPESAARLRELVEGKVVRLDFSPPLEARVDDMWGRLLARISVRGRDVARILLDEGHATPLPEK